MSREKSRAKSKDRARKSEGEKAQDSGTGRPGNLEEASRDQAAYDYVEGSVHDLVVRTDLFRAYEIFKVFDCIIRSF